MKKVGIITLNGYFNYGNRLQNYATEQILKSLDFKVVTIVDLKEKTDSLDQKSIKRQNFFKRLGASLDKNFFKKLKYKIYSKSNSSRIYQANELKMDRLKEFSNKYINERKVYIKNEGISEELNEEFDYFVVGSDQVWNPYNDERPHVNFLQFVTKEKRVSLSASFGVSEIPFNKKDIFAKAINEMNYLSVREEEGKDIIKRLTNRDSIVLLDPTMIVSKSDWLKVISPSKYKPKNKYLCTYFLGDAYMENERKIKQIAKENDLEIVNLNSIYDLNRYSIGVPEFLDFFNSAEIVLTDSFHGAVFSILFNRPFVVFKRGNMNSRIDTLLSKFKLEDRHWDYVKEHENYFDIDYSHVDAILEEEREKSFNYLKKALGLKKEE